MPGRTDARRETLMLYRALDARDDDTPAADAGNDARGRDRRHGPPLPQDRPARRPPGPVPLPSLQGHEAPRSAAVDEVSAPSRPLRFAPSAQMKARRGAVEVEPTEKEPT